MAAVAYEPAICVLTDAPGAPPEPGPVVEGPPPLAALSLEWRKRESPGGARPVVARLDPAASRMLLERSDEEVLALAMPAIAGVLGPPGVPWTQVKRWRYALPAGRADPSLVAVPESRIVLAGDAFTGTDLEAVMATGDRAAALVADLVG
jgi:predicted NAD/FAD-dependent oxidoreductase